MTRDEFVEKWTEWVEDHGRINSWDLPELWMDAHLGECHPDENAYWDDEDLQVAREGNDA